MVSAMNKRLPGHRSTATLLLLSMVLVCVQSSAVGQDRPVWARDLPNLPQRPGVYQGLGITTVTGDGAADWNDASGKARGQIAAQIRVRISSTVTRTMEETSVGSQISVADAYASTTEQITTASLEGIVLDRWFDEDTETLYAYGAISQAEVERRFRERMEDALAAARVFYASSNAALARRDPFTAGGQILEAIKVVSLAEAALDRRLNGSIDGRTESVPVNPFLQSQLCALFSKMRFEIVGGNQQNGERSMALAQPLKGRLMYASDQGTYPVSNALLRASFVPPAEGTLVTEVQTTGSGEFSVAVTEIQKGEALNRIRVMPALQGIDVIAASSPEIVRCWSTMYTDFAFVLRSRTNVSVAVRILEDHMGTLRSASSVQQEIQKRLIGSRFRIVEDSKGLAALNAARIQEALSSGSYNAITAAVAKQADVLILGEASSSERGNPFPQMFFSSGRAVIRILDCETGVIIGTVSVEDQKEAGPNYDTAGRKALEKMAKKVAEDVLAEMQKSLE